MRSRLLCIAALVFTVSGAYARAEPPAGYVLIVHRDNPVTAVDRHFVADAFLKKTTRWSNDVVIRPVDAAASSDVRRKFSKDVLQRSVAAVRTYWQQIVFSGRGIPPPELAGDAEIVSYVSRNAGAVGYVSAAAALDGVKVIRVE